MKKAIILSMVLSGIFFLTCLSTFAFAKTENFFWVTVKNKKFISITQEKPKDEIKIYKILFPENFPPEISKKEVIKNLVIEKKDIYIYRTSPKIKKLSPWKIGEEQEIRVTYQKPKINFTIIKTRPSPLLSKNLKKRFYGLYLILLFSSILINTAINFLEKNYYEIASSVLVVSAISGAVYSLFFLIFFVFAAAINGIIKEKGLEPLRIIANSLLITFLIFFAIAISGILLEVSAIKELVCISAIILLSADLMTYFLVPFRIEE